MAAPFEGMASINVCPKDQDKVQMAAKRLRCNKDIHGNNQYMCVPNKNKTSLVEFCYDGIMGLEDKGSCLEALSRKAVSRHNCTSFSSGCPNDKFLKSNVFKYPECQSINTKHRCYVSDPSCPPQKPDEQTSSLNTYVAIPVSLGAFLIITVIAAIALYWFCRRKGSKTAIPQGVQDELESLVPTGPVADSPKNTDRLPLSTIQTINDTGVDWNYVMQAVMQKMKETGANIPDINIDDLLDDALTLERSSWTQTTPLNPGPVADTPKNNDPFQLSTIKTITEMGIDWNNVMQAIIKKKNETDEDYKNTNDLIDAAMDWEEKTGRQATPSNPGPVADIPNKTAQFELSTIKTITEMHVDWNKVMQAMMQKMNETGKTHANLDDLINDALALDQHSGTRTTPSNLEEPTPKMCRSAKDRQFPSGMQ